MSKNNTHIEKELSDVLSNIDGLGNLPTGLFAERELPKIEQRLENVRAEIEKIQGEDKNVFLANYHFSLGELYARVGSTFLERDGEHQQARELSKKYYRKAVGKYKTAIGYDENTLWNTKLALALYYSDQNTKSLEIIERILMANDDQEDADLIAISRQLKEQIEAETITRQHLQNPYGTPNPYESGQPGYNPAPASRGVSMDVIGEAWKFVQPNLGPWIGAILVIGVISLIFNFLTQRLGMSVTPVSLPPGMPSTMPDGTAIPGLPTNTGVPTPNALYFVLTLISFVVNQFLAGGLMRMAIDQTRTGKVDFGRLFSAGDVILNLLIAGILSSIAITIGLVLCIVPGLILSALFALTTPLIVDKGRGGVDALTESLNLLKPHLGAMLVLLIVLVLINIAGALLCGLGLLVTIPLSVTAIALVYRDLTGGPSAPPTTNLGGPAAPIASPQ